MSKSKKKPTEAKEDEQFPLPIYNKKDDIYNREKEVPLDDEEEPGQKVSNQRDDNPAGDLDIPGSELDDADEEIGEEDEENNYYSLGGDAHEDLEEDKS